MNELKTPEARTEAAAPFVRELAKLAPKPVTIPLTRGYVALIDAEDFERVSALRWGAAIVRSKNGFRIYGRRAKNRNRGVSMHLHRFILETEEDVDHIDGDGLNNTKVNLRIATRSQNCANQKPRGGTSRFKGVSWHSPNNKWQAQIGKDGVNHYLGTFRDEFDAATAYNFAAVELFGGFARCNQP